MNNERTATDGDTAKRMKTAVSFASAYLGRLTPETEEPEFAVASGHWNREARKLHGNAETAIEQDVYRALLSHWRHILRRHQEAMGKEESGRSEKACFEDSCASLSLALARALVQLVGPSAFASKNIKAGSPLIIVTQAFQGEEREEVVAVQLAVLPQGGAPALLGLVLGWCADWMEESMDAEGADIFERIEAGVRVAMEAT